MSKKAKAKSINQTRAITESVICIIAVISGVYIIGNNIKASVIIPDSPYTAEIATTETPEDTTEDPNKVIYETISVDTVDKFKGPLILVNNDVEYFTTDENLVYINNQINEDGYDHFVANSDDMQLKTETYTAIADLLQAFYEQTDINDVVVYSGFRTSEEQQSLYDTDLANTGLDYSTKVALPGHSEHETGYAVDFTTSTTWDYDGLGDYSWIDEHCWRFGLILRYPEDKVNITEIQYEPWHYRYVGIPHAYYMYTNNLSFEEYHDLIKDYTYDTETLKISYNSTSAEVYFVPSDDGNDITFIPVPSGKAYEINGNNVDGFIVTVYEEERQAEDSTEPSTDATADEDADVSTDGIETSDEDVATLDE